MTRLDKLKREICVGKGRTKPDCNSFLKEKQKNRLLYLAPVVWVLSWVTSSIFLSNSEIFILEGFLISSFATLGFVLLFGSPEQKSRPDFYSSRNNLIPDTGNSYGCSGNSHNPQWHQHR